MYNAKAVPALHKDILFPYAEGAKKAAAGIKDSRPLYRWLSALGNAGEGSVPAALNKWLREGRETHSVDLERYVKELRRYKRHSQALEGRRKRRMRRRGT